MSVLSVFDGSARALEIARVVTRYEWSFLSQLLNRGDAAETRLPQPQVPRRLRWRQRRQPQMRQQSLQTRHPPTQRQRAHQDQL